MKGLRDKVALVTGGSSGIGQAIAIRLGEEGANVAINYVGRPEGAISTREAIEHGVEICMKKVAEGGGRPILVAADASDEQAVDQMFGQVLNEYGRLDILVNNAGIQIAGDSDEAAYITGQTLFVDGGRAGDRRTARPVDRIASNGSSCRIVIPPVTATRGAGRDDPWSRRRAPGVTPAAL